MYKRSQLKSFFLGKPLDYHLVSEQKLTNPVGLAVLSSDALSSVAYGPGEVLLLLATAGTAALSYALPVVLAVAVLLAIVVTSYRQTIHAYPSGGGSYIVAKENLGDGPGLTAAAALLVDYVLTVAVSISAAVLAITSALPDLRPYSVPMALVFVGVLAATNLRGIKEAGRIFSYPTFAFIGLLGFTVAWGLGRFALGFDFTVPAPEHAIPVTESIGLFLVLKAFASGCSAMTGVEAMANGVQLFREPSDKNAAKTLTWMGLILAALLLGVTSLAVLAGVEPSHSETVISQLSRAMFGAGPLYYVISAVVALILVLAANTAFADFPLLSSLVAGDDYLPRQLRDRGHKLVYSKGIILLTAASAVLLIVFGANPSHLIPLYAVGVFTSFTLSQAGMVMHHIRLREENWQRSLVINATGATATAIVTGIVAVAKFADGAWIVVILIPLIISYFLWVHRRYKRADAEMALLPDERVELSWQSHNPMHNHVVLLVKSIDRRLIRAIQYAKTIRADHIEALYVDIEGDGADFKRSWDALETGIDLVVVVSPHREIAEMVIEHISGLPRESTDEAITVVLPEYAPEDTADLSLHDQTSYWIKRALFNIPGVIFTDVPFHLNDPAREAEKTARQREVEEAERRIADRLTGEMYKLGGDEPDEFDPSVPLLLLTKGARTRASEAAKREAAESTEAEHSENGLPAQGLDAD